MERNLIFARSLHGRAHALAVRIDRIFLCRKLFVALAMVLGVSGLVFAQRPAHQQGNSSHASEATMSRSSEVLPSDRATAAEAGKEQRIIGETKPLGNGVARSWVSLDSNGNPTAVGLTFSEEALSNLPKEPPPGAEGTELSLELPEQASATPFKHIMLNWNPHGHPPASIYDLPHFDFHFYTISAEERGGITAKGDDLIKSRKKPDPVFIPEGYVYVPDSEIPRMGAHWVNPLSKELQGQKFTSTFLYGSYDGRLVFAEPMITKAFLETKTDVTEPLTQPVKYASRAYYPTKYSVRYDAATKEYTVALEGMTLR